MAEKLRRFRFTITGLGPVAFVLWYSLDDSLAAAHRMPWVGSVPYLDAAVVAVLLSFQVNIRLGGKHG